MKREELVVELETLYLLIKKATLPRKRKTEKLKSGAKLEIRRRLRGIIKRIKTEGLEE